MSDSGRPARSCSLPGAGLEGIIQHQTRSRLILKPLQLVQGVAKIKLGPIENDPGIDALDAQLPVATDAVDEAVQFLDV